MSKALITKTKKKNLQKNLQKTSTNRRFTQSDLNKKDIEELKDKFKTRGFTAGGIIGIIFLVVLGIPVGIVLLAVITLLIIRSTRSSVFGKQNIKKNKFFKKINNQIKKDYLKMILRRKKLKFNKSDKKKIKEIEKKLSKKGYTKIEIVGIMISIVMKVPVKVGIQYASSLVKKIINLS
tara:strand:- start:60 stop:596 length:537 start_codon:yes stop_codon:yes gene_type:complete